ITSRWRTTYALPSMDPRPMASVNFTATDLNPAAPRRAGFGTGIHVAARQPRASPARGTRSAAMAACTWSFKSGEIRSEQAVTWRARRPSPRKMAQAPRSFPRAVGDQREDRASPQAPRRRNAGGMIPDDRPLLATILCQTKKESEPPNDNLSIRFCGLWL